MKTPVRRSIAILPLLLPLAASGCSTTAGVPESHWNIDSVPSRMTHHFLGYQSEVDGPYRDFQWRKKKDINLTLRRHFLNNNPRNPLEPTDPSQTAVRPPHSVLPDPVTYFHAESLFIGGLFAAWTGAFVPIPIDSVIGTCSEGGWGEFKEGARDTFRGEYRGEIREPVPPSKFKVRHR